MIDHYTIKLAPAVSHKEIMKQFQDGAGPGPEKLGQLSKVKVKLEAIGDYEDMEKLRNLLKELSGPKTTRSGSS